MSLEKGLDRLGTVIATVVSIPTWINSFITTYPTIHYYSSNNPPFDSSFWVISAVTLIATLTAGAVFFIIFGITKAITWIIKGFKE